MQAGTDPGIAEGDVVGGRFEIVGLLGRGGQATVHRARDRTLGREVALKVFDPSSDLVTADRVQQEMQTLAGLEHPGIVGVYDVGAVDGRPYLVMRLVDRGSLAELLAGGRLDAEQAAVLTVALCEALRYVHGRGLVHRDLKPANVLLATDPTGGGMVPLLADFGTASPTTGPGDDGDQVVGTPAYLAPEQVAGDPQITVGPAADVYALGLVVLEALTGRREFTGPAGEVAVERLRRDPEVPTDLPGDLVDLLTAMTARDPRRRPTPARAGQVARRLAGNGDDGAVTARTGSPLVVPGADEHPVRASRVPRKRALATAAVALGVAGAVVGTWTSVSSDPPSVAPPQAPGSATSPGEPSTGTDGSGLYGPRATTVVVIPREPRARPHRHPDRAADR